MTSGRDPHGSFLAKRRGIVRLACGAVLVVAVWSSESEAQSVGPPHPVAPQTAPVRGDDVADGDLLKGLELTRRGQFREAIPLLLRARGQVAGNYAVGFNLALCYLGAGEFKEAIRSLKDLAGDGYNTAAMNNLLSQAYVGDGQLERAFLALKEAARQAPKDESLYAFVADACTDHYAYGLGLRVVDLGLSNMPDSARLNYERAVFLARLDRLEDAKPAFQRASELAPGSDLAYLALIQENLYEDKLPEALALAREGIKAGHRDYQMLSLLGTVLIHAGAMPGQPEFVEAREALEASVSAHPAYSTSQIALGKLYLMEGRPKEAVVHLERGRRLEPRNPAVYTSLARAYRQVGEPDKAQQSLGTLSELLREKTATTSAVDP
jgi:predicted Zn-dependent protease